MTFMYRALSALLFTIFIMIGAQAHEETSPERPQAHRGCEHQVAGTGLRPSKKSVTRGRASVTPPDRDFLVIGGAGVMGRGFAQRLAKSGLKVVVVDPNPKALEILGSLGHKEDGIDIELSPTLEAAVDRLSLPRKILLLVPNAEILSETLFFLRQLVLPGDIVIDGGNSFWKNTQFHENEMGMKGAFFVGMGVSGGERGARNGSSMMVGGNEKAYETLRPLLENIAATISSGDGTTHPSVAHIGPGGAGHYVKMVHNGIEYGEMQLIAEVFQMLRVLGGWNSTQIQKKFAEWNEDATFQSFLLKAAATVLNQQDESTGTPLVDRIADVSSQKGTGLWSVESALELGVFVPTLAAAVEARFASALKQDRMALSREWSEPPAALLSREKFDELLKLLPRALRAARLLTFAQGLGLIDAASKKYFGGRVSLGTVTDVWRKGSILESGLLEDLHRELSAHAEGLTPFGPQTLLDELKANQAALREVVLTAVAHAISVPCFSSTLTFFDSMRTQDSPANLVAALRDYFGGHQFELRGNRGVFFHDTWGDDVSASAP